MQFPTCEKYIDNEDLYFECVVKTAVFNLNRPVGTARMGDPKDPRTVVDPQLRVLNIKGLRVVDASVMPAILSGNTNIETLVMAEKASDIIKTSDILECDKNSDSDWYEVSESQWIANPLNPTYLDLFEDRQEDTSSEIPTWPNEFEFYPSSRVQYRETEQERETIPSIWLENFKHYPMPYITNPHNLHIKLKYTLRNGKLPNERRNSILPVENKRNPSITPWDLFRLIISQEKLTVNSNPMNATRNPTFTDCGNKQLLKPEMLNNLSSLNPKINADMSNQQVFHQEVLKNTSSMQPEVPLRNQKEQQPETLKKISSLQPEISLSSEVLKPCVQSNSSVLQLDSPMTTEHVLQSEELKNISSSHSEVTKSSKQEPQSKILNNRLLMHAKMLNSKDGQVEKIAHLSEPQNAKLQLSPSGVLFRKLFGPPETETAKNRQISESTENLRAKTKITNESQITTQEHQIINILTEAIRTLNLSPPNAPFNESSQKIPVHPNHNGVQENSQEATSYDEDICDSLLQFMKCKQISCEKKKDFLNSMFLALCSQTEDS